MIIDYFRETNRNERQEAEMMKKCSDCIYSVNLMFVEEGESSSICVAEESMSDEEKELAKEGNCPYYRAEVDPIISSTIALDVKSKCRDDIYAFMETFPYKPNYSLDTERYTFMTWETIEYFDDAEEIFQEIYSFLKKNIDERDYILRIILIGEDTVRKYARGLYHGTQTSSVDDEKEGEE